MKPATEAHRRTYELVRDRLREIYGPLLEEGENTPSFLVPGGPYGIRITVAPIGEDEAVVDVYTWLGRDLEVTPAVERFLLERNAALRFAALELDADGDIRLQASLFPEHASAAMLGRLAELVAAAAGEIEAELRSRFAS